MLQIGEVHLIEQGFAPGFERGQPFVCFMDLCGDDMYDIRLEDVGQVLLELPDFLFAVVDFDFQLIDLRAAPLPRLDLHGAVACKEIKQFCLDCVLDHFQGDHLTAPRADGVAPLVPAAVDIMAAHPGGFIDHRDRIAAFFAFHQAGKPAVRTGAAVFQGAVAIQLVLHIQPKHGIHNALMRGKRDKAA